MLASAPEISLLRLSLAAIPCMFLLAWMAWQSFSTGRLWLGLSRMVAQLLLIGFVLKFVFESENAWLLLAAMILMTVISAWIAAGSIPGTQFQNWWRSLLAIGLSGSALCLWILFVVLGIDPTNLRTAIPLAGMIYANSINSVSIAGERLVMERKRNDVSDKEARQHALTAAMIPVTNSLMAVGVVSIPGMMTGQILGGAEPQLAARYQIMVMLMLLASSGLAALIYLFLESRFPRTSVTETVPAPTTKVQ